MQRDRTYLLHNTSLSLAEGDVPFRLLFDILDLYLSPALLLVLLVDHDDRGRGVGGGGVRKAVRRGVMRGGEDVEVWPVVGGERGRGVARVVVDRLGAEIPAGLALLRRVRRGELLFFFVLRGRGGVVRNDVGRREEPRRLRSRFLLPFAVVPHLALSEQQRSGAGPLGALCPSELARKRPEKTKCDLLALFVLRATVYSGRRAESEFAAEK